MSAADNTAERHELVSTLVLPLCCLMFVTATHSASKVPEHDGLDPLPSVAIRQSHAKGTGVTRNQGLPKLVPIV